MKYVTKKKEPKRDPNKNAINKLSSLLVTAIKQNREITRVHAAQITKVVSDIKQMNVKPPVVNIQPSGKRTFHMDVNRGDDGFIKSVDGTIEE